MNCIAFAQGPVLKISTTTTRRATDPEIAILQLSDEEHAALHNDPKDFVNGHHIFDKDVNSMSVASHASNVRSRAQLKAVAEADTSATWLVLVRHRPDSSAVGACVPA